MQQSDGTNTLDFAYDEAGTVLGFRLNSSANYYYLKNLQGDVTAIYNASGTIVVRYTYDAWGNLLSMKDSNGSPITSPTHTGSLNPIRYRGYYYDAETKLYYLQSWYYDPVTSMLTNR